MTNKSKPHAKHAILPAVGTDGDIYPFVRLGEELRARGYRVTIATHQHFAKNVERASLEFCSFVSDSETDELLKQADFWHPLKGPIVIARWGAKLLERHYKVLAELASQSGSFLVASPGVVAARILQEKLGIPLVSIVLQPWILQSIYEPPVMMGGLTLPRWAPKPIGDLYYTLFNQVGMWLVGREINALRNSLGLGTMKRMFDWWFSQELVISMFPSWFGPPQVDWPEQVRLAGFPVSDGRLQAGVSPETLDFCRHDLPPIAFTFGTGMMHASELFLLGIQACEALGRRGILLTKFRDQLPRELPPFMHHSRFEPFQELFPHCAAVVHHGGIGTVAKTLAAGVPQLILPFAFDQLDNAVRIERLGAGGYCKRGRRSRNAFVQKLKEVLAGPCVDGARKVQSRFNDSGGIEKATNMIEDLLSNVARTGK